jgi:hypothetical protein
MQIIASLLNTKESKNVSIFKLIKKLHHFRGSDFYFQQLFPKYQHRFFLPYG